MRSLTLAAALAVGAAASSAGAQSTLDWPVGVLQPVGLDSGFLDNPGPAPAVVHAQVVSQEGASWIRLYFGEGVALEGSSLIRVTSLLDGQVQELDAAALSMWGDTTAYFNGDAVLVELVAGPQTNFNRLAVGQLAKGLAAQPVGDPGECGICGVDDRVQSSENWSSRLLPSGCTASVFNQQSCMVSAGHCVGGNMVVQFNDPDSSVNCGINQPPISEQFPIIAFDFLNAGIGQDWSVLRPGTNLNNQKPYDRYGELRPIAESIAGVGDPAAMWGYGLNTNCVWSQTQQTSDGEITFVSSTHYEFDVDVRGGNSGSALIHNDEIIGIVTHCTVGCPPNFGTRVDRPDFAAARDELCMGLAFTFPEGLPALVAPGAPTVIPVNVSSDGSEPMPGTGMVHKSFNGGGFVSLPMTQGAPNEYEATLPALQCGDVVAFYFSAQDTAGETLSSPTLAPSAHYASVSGLGLQTVFADDFQANLGWTVQSGGATDGQWQRVDPISTDVCNRGNPGVDGDGSGMCYVTDNDLFSCNSDVDGGSTILVSPILDASQDSMVVTYWRWFDNTGAGLGEAQFQDVFRVQVSGNGGGSWVPLETVGPTGPVVQGGWYQTTLGVTQVVGPTSQFRIRFIAEDAGAGSIVECGVDGVQLRSVECALPPCPWDVDADGQVSVTDLLDLLGAWGTNPGGPPDFDGNGTVDVNDLLKLLGNWGPCP